MHAIGTWIRNALCIAFVAALASACSGSSSNEASDAPTTTTGGSRALTTPADPTMKGRAFEYQVGDFHLRLTFEEENQVHWEYLSAPDGLTGKNAVEHIDRATISDDVVLLMWKEADGSQVLDILDFGRMKMFSNFVLNGERGSAVADVQEVG